jgi:hypothetical protein
VPRGNIFRKRIYPISKSKMISRRQGGGSADVFSPGVQTASAPFGGLKVHNINNFILFGELLNLLKSSQYVEEADDDANKDSALI